MVLNSVLETVHITNNLVPRRAKLSTTDVTAKTNLKPLVSVPVTRLHSFCRLILCAHSPTADTAIISRFAIYFPWIFARST